MSVEVYEEEFLEFIKERRNVTKGEVFTRFGEDAEWLINHHENGGYIYVEGDNLIFVKDCYMIGIDKNM